MAKQNFTKDRDLQREYKKERSRIQRKIRSMKKRGYEVPENILPNIPKKITSASINRLSKITNKTIENKSSWINPETGEQLTYRQSLGTIRRMKKEKPHYETRNIEGFINYLDSIKFAGMSPAMAEEINENRDVIKRWVDNAINDAGGGDIERQRFSKYLDQISERLYGLSAIALTDSSANNRQAAMVEISMLLNVNLTAEENIRLTDYYEGYPEEEY